MQNAKNPEKKQNESKPLFGMINFILFGIGAALIILGYYLMSGGGSDDPNVFNPDIFNSTRITVAPIVIMAGFIVNIVAIMKKPNN